MEKIFEKVATVNEKMIKEVQEYVESKSWFNADDVDSVMCDENGNWIEVVIDGDSITFNRESEITADLGGTYDVERVCSLADFMSNEDVIWEMYDNIINNFQVENDSIYKLFVMAKVGWGGETNMEITKNPAKRAEQIKDMWLVNMAMNDYDTPNADVTNTNSTMVVDVISMDNGSAASLIISWEEVTEEEIELFKGVANM